MQHPAATRILLLILPWLLLVSCGATASEQFPLGILGGQGKVEAGSNLLTIVKVHQGSPAQSGGLLAGDQLQGIGSATFSKHSGKVDLGGTGPQRSLGEALDQIAARTDEEHRKITLTLLRGEETRTIDVSLPHRPTVLSAEGRALLVKNCAQQLLSTQTKGGLWNAPVGLTGDRVLTAWALVALMSTGNEEYREAIDRGVEWLRGPEGNCWILDDPLAKGPDNLGNWAITASVMALTEHHLLSGDSLDLSVIERCCKALSARITDDGLFGHDVVPGYSRKGFNVINTLSHMAWAAASQVGITLDEKSWNSSLEQIRNSLDSNGGIRYWTMKGTGTQDASLRTSSMALALSIASREQELAKTLAKYLATHPQRTRKAHAVGSMGMILTPSALWRLDREGYQTFLDEWRWYLALTQQHDGSIRYIGGKKNNGGDSYLGVHRIGCIIATMIVTPQRQFLLMNGKALKFSGNRD